LIIVFFFCFLMKLTFLFILQGEHLLSDYKFWQLIEYTKPNFSYHIICQLANKLIALFFYFIYNKSFLCMAVTNFSLNSQFFFFKNLVNLSAYLVNWLTTALYWVVSFLPFKMNISKSHQDVSLAQCVSTLYR